MSELRFAAAAVAAGAGLLYLARRRRPALDVDTCVAANIPLAAAHTVLVYFRGTW